MLYALSRHGSPACMKCGPHVTPKRPLVQMPIKRRSMLEIVCPKPAFDQPPHSFDPLCVHAGDWIHEVLTVVHREVPVSKILQLVIGPPHITVNGTARNSRGNDHWDQRCCIPLNDRLYHHPLCICIDHSEHPELWHPQLSSNVVFCLEEMRFVDLHRTWA